MQVTQQLYTEDAYLQHAEARVLAVDERGVALDRTVFYPLGGGQPADTGDVLCADGRVAHIVDVRKDADGVIWHRPDDDGHGLIAGDAVQLRIDWARRHRLMRTHSALHLLSSVIPYPVTGGNISLDKGRLDFDLPDALDKEQLTAQLNAWIERDVALEFSWISDAELAAQPELVKTMSVKPPMGAGRVRLVHIPGIDLQPCGGTHVRRTGEIGPVRVSKIENKGKQNRRVHLLLES